MPVLSINGQQVQVDDSFTGMAPADQQALVNHIASQLSAGSTSSAPAAASAPVAAPVPGFVPGQAPTPDQLAGLAANWGKTNSGTAPTEWQPPADNMPAPLRAFSTGAVESVPIVGALAHNSRDPMMQAIDARAAQQAPIAAGAGQTFGTIAPFMVGGEVPGIAKILGMDAEMGLGAQAAAGAGSMAAINGADAAVRGDTPDQIAVNTGLGALGGAAGPLVGKALGAAASGIGGIGGKFAGLVQGIRDPEAAANAAFGRAAASDVLSGQPLISQADQAAAARNGQPLMNADLYGKNTMALARAVSDLSPDANATLSDALTARSKASNGRAIDFLKGMFGNTDIAGAQSGLQSAARKFNSPAWNAAYDDPAAKSIFTDGIGKLMQNPEFRQAIPEGVREANRDAYLGGRAPIANPFSMLPAGGPIANPFRMTSDGGYKLLNGSVTGPARTPSLQFWAGVSRALGKQAQDGGPAYEQMRQALNSELDNVVPQYQTARQGAATFFGAQDALEAGQKFVGMPQSQLSGAQAALNKMSNPEKQLFQMGFGGNLIDKVSKAGESDPGVVDRLFSSDVAKQQVQMAMGNTKAAQLEAFLRVQNIMKQRNNYILGGSNTAAKQAAMAALTSGGIGGATGYGAGVASGGGFDPRHWSPTSWATAAGVGALGRTGYKYLGQKVDTAVLPRIAQLLVSTDPTAAQQATTMAARNPRSMAALRAIEHGMQGLTQAGTAAIPGEMPSGPEAPTPPLKISVGATPAVQ